MALVAHSVVISQPGADLNITSGGWEMVLWSPPSLEPETRVISGPYQAGERLRSWKPAAQIIGGVFRAKGSNWAAVEARRNDLYVALQQFSYTVTVTVGGVVETFTHCQPATIRPRGGFRTSGEVASGFADFEIEIRCTPNIGS